MAFYKWLVDGNDPYNEESWPPLGERSVDRTPVAYESGWACVQGSDVCSSIPWDKTPVELWRIETEGEHALEGVEVRWSAVTPVESLGTLDNKKVLEIALDWAEAEYEHEFSSDTSRHSRFRIDWVRGQIDNYRKAIQGLPHDVGLLNKHSWLPMVYCFRAYEAVQAGDYDKAWIHTGYIAKDCINKQTRLEMARRLSERLEK